MEIFLGDQNIVVATGAHYNIFICRKWQAITLFIDAYIKVTGRGIGCLKL